MVHSIRIEMLGKHAEVELTENVITESTVKRAFLISSGAIVSLSYERDSRRINCRVNEAGTSFLLPDDWPAMQFFVESKIELSRPTTANDQTLNERLINPYYPILPRDPAPTSEAFIKWMFFLQDKTKKATTICVHPRFFVTFRHGTHLQFKLGDALKMYSAEKEVNNQVGIDVCVVTINEKLDFVLLKSKFDVVEYGPSIAKPRESEPFTLAGFGNEEESLSYLPGEFHSVSSHYFSKTGSFMGPFIFGTSQSSKVYSGGAIWGSLGLIGMNVGCTTMALHNHHLAISEPSTFIPKNVISPAFYFKNAYVDELQKERREEKVALPTKKKPCIMVEFEGLGILEGYIY